MQPHGHARRALPEWENHKGNFVYAMSAYKIYVTIIKKFQTCWRLSDLEFSRVRVRVIVIHLVGLRYGVNAARVLPRKLAGIKNRASRFKGENHLSIIDCLISVNLQL